jgi:hypothetical protein
MKLWRTLIQPWREVDLNRTLDNFLGEQGIEYALSADFADELSSFGYKIKLHYRDDRLLKKAVVLIDDHELSAILLSVDDVSVIKNRPWIETKNKFRKLAKWLQILK